MAELAPATREVANLRVREKDARDNAREAEEKLMALIKRLCVDACGGMAPKTWAAPSEVAQPTRSRRAQCCLACTARHCIVPNRILYL